MVRQLLINEVALRRLMAESNLNTKQLLKLILTYAYTNRISKQSLYSLLRLINFDVSVTVSRLRVVNDEAVEDDHIEPVDDYYEVVERDEHRIEERYLGQRILERLMPIDQ